MIRNLIKFYARSANRWTARDILKFSLADSSTKSATETKGQKPDRNI